MPGGDPVSFYSKSLERGLRSERALKLAIAEMYLKGVSTRKVVEVTEQLCGLEVSSSDSKGSREAVTTAMLEPTVSTSTSKASHGTDDRNFETARGFPRENLR